MSVRIRLRRMGAKKKPFYRIVVADQREARDGRFIDQLGYYDPTTEPPTMKVDEEKAKKWLGNGAQPSEVVKMLLRRIGVLESVKQQVEEKPQVSKKARKKAAEAEAAPAPAAAATVTEAPAEAPAKAKPARKAEPEAAAEAPAAEAEPEAAVEAPTAEAPATEPEPEAAAEEPVAEAEPEAAAEEPAEEK